MNTQQNTTTTFVNQVLLTVAQIPRGSTMSYAEVATAAGSPGAYRAVGTIMANNRNAAVPCHRVIHTSGALGRYNRGGVERKKQLLESEGVKVRVVRGRYYQVTNSMFK